MSNKIGSAESLYDTFGLQLTESDLQELRDQLDQLDVIEREAQQEILRNPRIIGNETIRRAQQPADQEGEI